MQSLTLDGCFVVRLLKMERSSVLTLKFNMSEYDFVTLQLVTVSAHTKREDF